MPLSRLFPVEPPPHELKAVTETMQTASDRARSPMRDPARNILQSPRESSLRQAGRRHWGLRLSVLVLGPGVPVFLANDEAKREERRKAADRRPAGRRRQPLNGLERVICNEVRAGDPSLPGPPGRARSAERSARTRRCCPASARPVALAPGAGARSAAPE